MHAKLASIRSDAYLTCTKMYSERRYDKQREESRLKWSHSTVARIIIVYLLIPSSPYLSLLVEGRNGDSLKLLAIFWLFKLVKDPGRLYDVYSFLSQTYWTYFSNFKAVQFGVLNLMRKAFVD